MQTDIPLKSKMTDKGRPSYGSRSGNWDNNGRNSNVPSIEEEIKFKHCEFCASRGHDLATFLKRLEAIHVEGPQIFQRLRIFKRNLETAVDGISEQPNCAHFTQGRGPYGSEQQISQTRDLKKQLEEVLKTMECWLETLENAMDWEHEPFPTDPRTTGTFQWNPRQVDSELMDLDD